MSFLSPKQQCQSSEAFVVNINGILPLIYIARTFTVGLHFVFGNY